MKLRKKDFNFVYIFNGVSTAKLFNIEIGFIVKY